MASPALGTGAGNVSTAYRDDAATDISIAKPTSTASGDLLILVTTADKPENLIDSITGGTSWGSSVVESNDALMPSLEVFVKYAGGSEPTNYTVADSTTDSRIVHVYRITGAHATTAVNQTTVNSVDTTDVVVSSITPTVTDTLVIAIAGQDYRRLHPATITTSGYTLIATTLTGGSGQVCLAAAQKDQATAAATGTATLVQGGTAGTEGTAYAHIAIAPTGASGSTITVTSQPSNDSVTDGGTASFTFTVTSTDGPLTYQWYEGASGTTTSPLSGKTSANLSFTATLSDNGNTYWCRATDQSNDEDSVARTLTVTAGDDYPSIGFKYQIKPFGKARYIYATESGGLGGVAQDGATKYEVQVMHPLVSAAERSSLLDYYDDNKNAEREITLTGTDYNFRFHTPYTVTTDDGVYFYLKATLIAEKA